MRFKYTILYVKDVPKTLDFYQRAFAMTSKFLHDSRDYAELDTGDTTLSFASTDLMKLPAKNPASENSGACYFEVAFETEDVRTALTTALGAGANLVQDLRREPWGQDTAFVTDLNGFLVENLLTNKQLDRSRKRHWPATGYADLRAEKIRGETQQTSGETLGSCAADH